MVSISLNLMMFFTTSRLALPCLVDVKDNQLLPSVAVSLFHLTALNECKRPMVASREVAVGLISFGQKRR